MNGIGIDPTRIVVKNGKNLRLFIQITADRGFWSRQNFNII